MNVKAQIKEITHFCKTFAGIVLCNSQNEILLGNRVVYKSEKSLQEIYCLDGRHIFTNTIDGEGIAIDLETLVSTKYDLFIKKYDFPYQVLSNKSGTYCIDLKNRLKSNFEFRCFQYYVNFKENKLINESREDKTIRSYSLFPKDDLAIFDLSTLISFQGVNKESIKITQFAGMFEDTVVCSMESGGILLLDVKKGEMVQYFDDAKIVRNIYPKTENSSLFWGFNHQTFIEIDAAKAQILRKIDLTEQLKKIRETPTNTPNWTFVDTSICENELIYFKARTNMIGIFDPIKESIIDYHSIDFDQKGATLKGGKENFQVIDNKIYTLGSNGVLYILER